MRRKTILRRKKREYQARKRLDPEWREQQRLWRRNWECRKRSDHLAKFLESNPHATVEEIYTALPWLFARRPELAKKQINQALEVLHNAEDAKRAS